ncbi:MAG TPA: methionyl-tRNA formyltransferase [Candidatus Hydrogenedentes bacterium]|nr:methionyl-tRNA formyltransferase [Candidatus Hydrogenedentota bacterium]
MRIALAGTGPLGVTLLSAMLDSPHEVVALLRNGRVATAVGKRLLPPLAAVFAPQTSVLGLARRAKLPVFYIDRMDESELAPLRRLEPDLLLVGGFGIVLKRPLLELPPRGCVNCHSSLLPKHRGPNPFTAAILAGETESGVTFHEMTEGIDAGAILLQHAFPIDENDTGGSVYRKSCITAGALVLEVLDALERGDLHRTPQDEAAATYDKRLREEQLHLDWSRPARELDRLVRACVPFSLARFTHRGRTVYVSRTSWDGEASQAPPGTITRAAHPVRIAAGHGHLVIEAAHTATVFAGLWPGLFKRPRVGERLG